jgi:hypothetical protein
MTTQKNKQHSEEENKKGTKKDQHGNIAKAKKDGKQDDRRNSERKDHSGNEGQNFKIDDNPKETKKKIPQ